jgi:exopolysaccharide/PEP-CTERM locus tyrosine autokinase
MSFVERALKKLQESRAASPGLGLQQPRGAVNADMQAGHAFAYDRSPAPGRVPPVLNTPVAAVPARVVPTKRLEVDRAALRAAGLLPPEHQERQIAGDYRQIKRPLIATATGRGAPQVPNGNVIMVASALPGEGKTFTSVNLAMSIARERDVQVVLVDADVAKPHISRTLGIDGEKGLLDLLSDEALDVETLLFSTDVQGLSILPAGLQSDTATELLASTRMEQLLATMSANDPRRIIVLDSPPLLLTSEARVLSAAAGQVVVVVRAGYTAQQAVLDAIGYLGDHGSISLILNQSQGTASEGYYHGQVPYGAAAEG